VSPDRHRSTVIEFPNELEIVLKREFDAPIALVFDVLTKPEHVRHWGATPPDRMLECSIDLRVGGSYHSSFLTADGTVFSFDGTYLEVEPPTRTVETWHFDHWPDVEAVENMQLDEADGVTTFTWTMAFRDAAGRAHMSAFDGEEPPESGQLDSLDAIEDILKSLLDPSGTVTE
jgi:uncharacterized protein YndB with AHSA1/START domain